MVNSLDDCLKMRIEPTQISLKICLLLLMLSVQTLWSQDTIPPVIVTPGLSKTTGCEGGNIMGEFNQWYSTAGGTIATDNSGVFVLVANLPFNLALARFNASADTLCGNTKNVVLEFRAIDQANNVSEPVIISFSVIDTLAPIIFVRPEASAIECTASSQDSLNNWIKNKGGAKASDICSPTVNWTVFYYQTSTGIRDSASIADGPYPQIPIDACNWNVIVSFKVLDECGNPSVTPIRAFDVKDTKPPVFSNLPPNITVSCDRVPLPALITAEDACAGVRPVSFSETSTKHPSPVQCNHYNYQLTRTWTVSDLCGNSASHRQIIQVKDTIGPVIAGQSPLTVSCDEIGLPDSLLTQKNDACSPIFLSYTDSLVNGNVCSYQSKRTYTATDVCNNVTRFTQVLNVRDNIPPKITAPAQNMGLECDQATNVQAAFESWLVNKGGSEAVDGCSSGLNYFVAVPGSYVLGDTTSYPGIAPGMLDPSNCPSNVPFYTRGERVDFVYYDDCGNTSVTSAFFGLRDNVPPTLSNCVPQITVQTNPGSCEASVSFAIPEATDNCAQFASPLVRTATSIVTSAMPGSNEAVVFSVNLNFGPYAVGAFSPTDESTLVLDLVNLDADDVSEFFNIVDEDGNLLGMTNNTDGQCGDGRTEFNTISAAKITQWLADGMIQFQLIPNNPGAPVLAINDVCSGSRINGSLSIPIDPNNLLTTRYTLEGSGDTTEIVPPANYSATLEAGLHQLSFLYTDCGGNLSKCITQITVQDQQGPVISCPPGINNLNADENCEAQLNLPLLLAVTDNCGFPSTYDENLPVSNEAKKIQFRFNESNGNHLALNKSITFPLVPLIKYHTDAVIVEVNAFGDLNDVTEYFDIIGEGGYSFGKTRSSNGTGCGSSVTRFELPVSTYNDWASDGEITITAVANNMPGEEGNGINPCNFLTPNQTIDDNSFLSIRLIVNNPVITYKIDNAAAIVLGQEDTLRATLSAGIHKIKFETKDNQNNGAFCETQIQVRDNITPEARCKGFVVRLHPSGANAYLLHPDSINSGSTDNCAIDTTWVVNGVYNCSDIGNDRTAILFVKDASGNVASCSAPIRIEAGVLTPTFTAGLCEGDTLKLFANVPPGGNQNQYTFEWYRNDVLVANIENPKFSNAGSGFNGVYRALVKGLNGCFAEGLVTVNIQPLTTPGVTTDFDNYCESEAILLTTNSFTGDIRYEWYEGFPPNGVLIGNTTSPEFTIAPSSGIHNYYVIALSQSCTSNPSPTKRLTIYKKPIVVLLSSFENICEGGAIQLGTTTTGQGYSYQWTGPDGYFSDLANPAQITNVKSEKQGKYQLVISVGNCKSDTATTNVIILPTPPQPEITGESIYCEGSTFSLVVNNLPIQEKYTWYKDGEKFRVTNENSLEILNVATSASGLWQVVVESNGCASDTSEAKLISIDNLSVIGAANTGPACEGDTIDLSATFVPNSTYKWSGPGSFTATGQFVKAPAKSGEYFVTITTTTGCENVTSTSVEVNVAPVITALSNNSTLCMDGKTDIVFSPSIFPPGSYEYKWQGPNGFMQEVAAARLINATPVINGSYILRVFNRNCPSEPDTNIITIQLIPPAASLTAPAKVCEGDSLTIRTTAIADLYEWHTPGGILQTTLPFLTIPNVTETAEGNYHCLVKTGDCFSTAFELRYVTIEARPLPPGIEGNKVLCFGDTLKLSSNVTGIQNAVWKGPNGLTAEGLTLTIPKVKNIHDGGYQVSVLKDGCYSAFSQLNFVEVKDSIVPASPTEASVSLCKSEESTLQLCIRDYDGSKGYTFEWRIKGGAVLGSTLQECIEVSTSLFIEGEQLVEVWAIKDGCRALSAGNVVVSKRAAPSFAAQANIEETTVCGANNQIELNSAFQSPEVDVNWISLSGKNNILSPQSGKTLVSGFEPGLNVIVLSYSKEGCLAFSTDTVKIFLLDAPDAIDDSYTGTLNGIINFDPLINDEFDDFYSLQIENPDVRIGSLELQGNGYKLIPATGFAGILTLKYELCVEGCDNLCDEAEISFQIGYETPCVPPTIFTPNGDGVNDKYVIPCIETGRFADNELIIFNQWGDQVYQAKPYDNGWEGTYGGDPLPTGTYYFIFNPGRNSNRLNGFIIIQR